ncbi:CHAT domain-containing protein [Saccharopolyspora sp. 6V]|uniref:CHAT domain-containing protein n=1 Tax=Saccharopolyspora sp. 6V TaxID=2877239 RepID=UPI001CD33014|nr:CHAT domain-containing protein [Saccharopolyspora sp. 6V]MCA1195641.1 CHAT domain-containing protein [Saccharopolyspora sp. 6V]
MSAGTALAPSTEPISAAVRWRDRVCADPDGAARAADRWLARSGDPELRVLARHIRALVAVERGRSAEARQHARVALAAARRERLPDRAAQVLLTCAWVELDRGDPEAAWRHLEAAAQQLTGQDAVRASCLRGVLLFQQDRQDEAVAVLSTALPGLAERGDHQWAANAHVARGLAHLYRNRLDEAEADLAAAEHRFRAAGRDQRAALCRHNRGCVALRAGDLPRALRLFDEARAAGADPAGHPEIRVDRAEALAEVGLHDQAREELHRAASRLQRLGRVARLGDTWLALAGCALRAGDPEAAIRPARCAARLFRSQRRHSWAALAVAVEWQARLRVGQVSRYALAAARRAGHACAEHGWTTAAAEVWLVAGREAARAGRRSTARALLELAAPGRGGGPGATRQLTVGWLAESLLAADAGDHDRLFAACRRGLRAVASYASGIAAWEPRIEAFGLAEELGSVAVGAALRSGDPRLVLRWVERHRLGAAHRRSVRPPTDPELGSALVRLRSAVSGAAEADGSRLRSALSEIGALERRVRDRALLVDGGAIDAAQPAGTAEVLAALRGDVLLVLFAHEGILHAVSVVDGNARLHELGAELDAVHDTQRLRYLLARQAETGDQRAGAVYAASAAEAAAAEQRPLLRPVAVVLPPRRRLVVVPTGALHAVPWAALPLCRGRGVTVAPSLRAWLRGGTDAARECGSAEPVWVSGPSLEHAEGEVVALHRVGGGRLLTGAAADAERVLAAVDGAPIAHIAAHGRFRDDQPLLSCLELADGPLYGYDLDRLRRGPRTVVLSACEAGRSVPARAGQLTGLAAALLGRGTATVIASVVPVPDERTARVMMSLHSLLRRGVGPAETLAAAQAAHGEAGFLCLGHGG